MTSTMKEVPQQEYVSMTKEQFKEKYPNISKEDVDFYFPEKKILDVKIEVISLRTYENIIEKQREFNNYNYLNPTKPKKLLSEVEINKIKLFETREQVNKIEGFKNQISYWEKIYTDEVKQDVYKEGLVPDKKTLYKNFLISYKYLNQVEFIVNDQSIKNIEPIIKYFAFDKTYFDSENVVKKVGNKELLPSFEKGLLLVGNVGNGKTSVMRAMEFMIRYYADLSIKEMWDTSGDWNRLKFKFRTTESLVSEFEYLESQELKDIFFKGIISNNLFLDDLKKEKNASNYGITNVIGSCLEKRYNNLKNYTGEGLKKFRTYATMNYHKDYPNDVKLAIEECGIRYGEHIYDRIFEMFNVVEFKGKSFRI